VEKKMNVLIIGSGGREHALAKVLTDSPGRINLFANPGNPGIFELAGKADIDLNNFDSVAGFCKERNIDLVVVGPEQPLADGIAEKLIMENIPVFGPVSAAAKLESSKEFAKKIMAKKNVPTAAFRSFTIAERDDAHRYLDGHSLPIVLKADGLAAGKGVVIAENHREAHFALDEMFGGMFGSAGDKVVVEEFMFGEEASVFAITDGVDFVTLPPSQDHKRAEDGDKGPNTGGMGAYAPAPVVSPWMMREIEEKIIAPVLGAMREEGIPFVGCLYCGLMITETGPKVVEFNVRFGDPETQAVLSIIDGNFAALLHSAATGKLDKSLVKYSDNKFATCVVLASGGYPGKYEKGRKIIGLEKINPEKAGVYHAGTKTENGKLLTSGGRVLGITGIGKSLEESIKNAYEASENVSFEGMYLRRDIGRKGLRK
jgi:phosphoribosylamine--glycine ligase